MNYENTEGCRIIQAGFQEQTLQVVRTITRENDTGNLSSLLSEGRSRFFSLTP